MSYFSAIKIGFFVHKTEDCNDKSPFSPEYLPLASERIDQLFFIRELIEANKKVAQYQVLLQNTKLQSQLLLNPVMLHEAVQSTKIEGTQKSPWMKFLK
ncbi:Fic/DOC family N-terminal domain-containing protein [Ferviditalea candida]|uniref:Fic/DOC family N-terminal domain-containing protein n=1 Tax=Ferviditalea candida TaxID=3108399 RepID=A0ABU5ZK80_9BACL|nr:Fic/DOC family N-terminal domain-containing protein [Paenibacillaceae bacterium T2]